MSVIGQVNSYEFSTCNPDLLNRSSLGTSATQVLKKALAYLDYCVVNTVPPAKNTLMTLLGNSAGVSSFNRSDVNRLWRVVELGYELTVVDRITPNSNEINLTGPKFKGGTWLSVGKSPPETRLDQEGLPNLDHYIAGEQAGTRGEKLRDLRRSINGMVGIPHNVRKMLSKIVGTLVCYSGSPTTIYTKSDLTTEYSTTVGTSAALDANTITMTPSTGLVAGAIPSAIFLVNTTGDVTAYFDKEIVIQYTSNGAFSLALATEGPYTSFSELPSGTNEIHIRNRGGFQPFSESPTYPMVLTVSNVASSAGLSFKTFPLLKQATEIVIDSLVVRTYPTSGA